MYQALPALPYCKRRKAGRGTVNEARAGAHKTDWSIDDTGMANKFVPCSANKFIPCSANKFVPCSANKFVPCLANKFVPCSANKFVPCSANKFVPCSAHTLWLFFGSVPSTLVWIVAY